MVAAMVIPAAVCATEAFQHSAVCVLVAAQAARLRIYAAGNRRWWRSGRGPGSGVQGRSGNASGTGGGTVAPGSNVRGDNPFVPIRCCGWLPPGSHVHARS